MDHGTWTLTTLQCLSTHTAADLSGAAAASTWRMRHATRRPPCSGSGLQPASASSSRSASAAARRAALSLISACTRSLSVAWSAGCSRSVTRAAIACGHVVDTSWTRRGHVVDMSRTCRSRARRSPPRRPTGAARRCAPPPRPCATPRPPTRGAPCLSGLASARRQTLGGRSAPAGRLREAGRGGAAPGRGRGAASAADPRRDAVDARRKRVAREARRLGRRAPLLADERVGARQADSPLLLRLAQPAGPRGEQQLSRLGDGGGEERRLLLRERKRAMWWACVRSTAAFPASSM